MVFSSLAANLLQGKMRYFKEDDPVGALIFVISVGGIILAAFLVNLMRHGIGRTGDRLIPSQPAAPRQFSIFTLYRLAHTYDLNREQTKILEQIFKSHGVREPQRIMADPVLLDNHFKRAYRAFEKNYDDEQAAQQKIALLFSLRNTIENRWGRDDVITSTRQIGDNANVILTMGNERYPARVLSSKAANMSVECSRDVRDNLRANTHLTLSFFTKSGNGLSFNTRVAGISDDFQNPAVQLAHSDNVKLLSYQRKFQRKETMLACFFALVTVTEVKTGWKKTKKMTADKRKTSGNIMDISLGGCAIHTNTAAAAGSSLKIEIIYRSDTRPIAVLGQILRINRGGSRGTTIHIKFIKIPRRAWNIINAMVFNYEGE
ncbi:MAG: PilZ domain-containing protein [Spirochaetaceae bacterium]|jgi:c-di-GMP-binding flagellar brake protein YcgR|nr:PilZ domain-containing protein [Spirochaetaceae bacterium]